MEFRKNSEEKEQGWEVDGSFKPQNSRLFLSHIREAESLTVAESVVLEFVHYLSLELAEMATVQCSL